MMSKLLLLIITPLSISLQLIAREYDYYTKFDIGRTYSDSEDLKYNNSGWMYKQWSLNDFLANAPGTNCFVLLYVKRKNRIGFMPSKVVQDEMITINSKTMLNAFATNNVCGFLTTNLDSRVLSAIGSVDDSAKLVFGVANRSLTKFYKIDYVKYSKYNVVKLETENSGSFTKVTSSTLLDARGLKMLVADIAYGIYYCNLSDDCVITNEIPLEGSVFRFDMPPFMTEGETNSLTITRLASYNDNVTLHILTNGWWMADVIFDSGESGSKSVALDMPIDDSFDMWKGIEVCIKTLNRSVITW
jgi:hypothetical protein